MTATCYLIGIVGGSASGKTRLAHAVAEQLAGQGSQIIKEDDYYVDAGNMRDFDPSTFNFDEPAAKDHDLLASHLDALRAGLTVEIPQYDFTTHCRSETVLACEPRPVIVVEGLHLLADPDLAARFDLSVYVHACEATRYARREKRDVAERGRTPDFVRQQFDTIVQPMHALYVEPQRKQADMVLENMGAPDFDILAAPILRRIDVLAGKAVPRDGGE